MKGSRWENPMKIEPRQEHINESCRAAKEAFYMEAERERSGYLEFLYQQSRFIRKSWWAAQAALLVLLYLLLCYDGSDYAVRRSMGALAPLFMVMIMPEMWKSRGSNTMEIEGAAYYSIRQIYSARILLFAFADGLLISAFSAVTLNTTSVNFTEMVVQFFLPMTVSGCICFTCLCAKRASSEYTAIFLSLIFSGIWTAVTADEAVYNMISAPVWAGICAAAFVYLVYALRKAVVQSNSYWEVNGAWN